VVGEEEAVVDGRAGRGPGGGRGSAYTRGRVKTRKVGLCKDLKENVFDFRTTSAADQMRISQDKISQYISAKYGEDIANKFQNKTRIVLSSPAYQSTTMTQHTLWIALVRSQQAAMLTARLSSHTLLEAEIALAPRRPFPGHGAREAQSGYRPSGL
jgi:hypothetical protein